MPESNAHATLLIYSERRFFMARFVASLLYFGFIVFAAGAAIAQSTVPDRRVVLTQDVDFVGSDIANIFDTIFK